MIEPDNPENESLSEEDLATVTRQIGREPKPFTVAARCPFGKPSVIANEPSQKLPTTFWLTCPSLDAAIARVEAAGGVRDAQEAVGEDSVAAIHERHRREFGVRVAGVREGGYVKCLHAFTALHLAGGIENPVGEWTLSQIERPYPEKRCCSTAEEEPG